MSPTESSDPPQSRFPVPDLSALPEALQSRLAAMQARAGFLPNVAAVLGYAPPDLTLFLDWHDRLMEDGPGLSRLEREMIVVVTSAANRCLYCVVAHAALVRLHARDPILADVLAVQWREADLSPREVAILDLAERLAVQPWTVTDAHLHRLEEQGVSQEEIWQTGMITAFFALSNRMAALTGMRPNPEFHLLGRVPKPVYQQLVAKPEGDA